MKPEYYFFFLIFYFYNNFSIEVEEGGERRFFKKSIQLIKENFVDEHYNYTCGYRPGHSQLNGMYRFYGFSNDLNHTHGGIENMGNENEKLLTNLDQMNNGHFLYLLYAVTLNFLPAQYFFKNKSIYNFFGRNPIQKDVAGKFVNQYKDDLKTFFTEIKEYVDDSGNSEENFALEQKYKNMFSEILRNKEKIEKVQDKMSLLFSSFDDQTYSTEEENHLKRMYTLLFDQKIWSNYNEEISKIDREEVSEDEDIVRTPAAFLERMKIAKKYFEKFETALLIEEKNKEIGIVWGVVSGGCIFCLLQLLKKKYFPYLSLPISIIFSCITGCSVYAIKKQLS